MLILVAEVLTEYNNMNYFFGFLGIACALIFASKLRGRDEGGN